MRRTKQEAMATRDAILDAAELLFYRQGVASTSLAEIAVAAKVTRGAIYWHFSGKADLFRAMSERVATPEEEFFLSRIEGDQSGSLDGLRVLALEMMRRFAADEHAQRVHEILLFRCEFIGEMGEVLERRRQRELAFDQVVLDTFARADGGRGLAPGWSPGLAAAALRCAVLGAIADWLRLKRAYDLEAVGRALLDGLFANVSRPPSSDG